MNLVSRLKFVLPLFLISSTAYVREQNNSLLLLTALQLTEDGVICTCSHTAVVSKCTKDLTLNWATHKTGSMLYKQAISQSPSFPHKRQTRPILKIVVAHCLPVEMNTNA